MKTAYNYRLFVSAGTVFEKTFIGVAKVPINFIHWRAEVMPRISPPISIYSTHNIFTKKLTVIFPICESLWTDFNQPKFFKVTPNEPEELETDIVNGKLIKVSREQVGEKFNTYII